MKKKTFASPKEVIQISNKLPQSDIFKEILSLIKQGFPSEGVFLSPTPASEARVKLGLPTVIVEEVEEDTRNSITTLDEDIRLLPIGADGTKMGKVDIVVIGDIHGCLHTMSTLKDQLGFNADWSHPDGLIAVFDGDLINKGTPQNSIEVLKELMECPSALVTDSNHGIAVANGIFHRDKIRSPWSKETVEAIWSEGGRFPHEVANYLRSLPSSLSFETNQGKIIVAHASMKKSLIGKSSPQVSRYTCFTHPSGWVGDEIIILAHEPVKTPRVITQEGFTPIVKVDTGCYLGGGLSWYDSRTGTTHTIPTDPRDLR